MSRIASSSTARSAARVERAGRELVARVEQLLRTQEAADVIGAKRRLRARAGCWCCHSFPPGSQVFKGTTKLCEDGAMTFRRIVAAACVLAAPAAFAAAPAQAVVVQGLDCRGDESRRGGSTPIERRRSSPPRSRASARSCFAARMQTLGASSVVWRGDSTHLPRETLVADGARGSVRRAGRRERIGPCCRSARRSVDGMLHRARGLRRARRARCQPRCETTTGRARLPDLLPAITACLSREGNRAQSVAGASPAGSGTIARAHDRRQRRRRLHRRRRRPRCAIDRARRPRVCNGTALLSCPRAAARSSRAARLERVQLRAGTAGYLHYEPC